MNIIDLNKYINADIMKVPEVRFTVEEMNRKLILEQHAEKHVINQGGDGFWRTRVEDKSKKDGRRMIKKKTKKEVEDEVVRYYTSIKPSTFDDCYHRWRTTQDVLIADNSIKKYDTDYARYFKDTDFSKKDICKITEEDIKVFIVEKVKSLCLCKKACKTLYGYLNNTFKSARINKIMTENPMEFLEPKQFYKYCTEKPIDIERKIVSDEDMEKLYKKLTEDYQKNPHYIPLYAVELAIYTGMRVGELSGLRWCDIQKDHIVICKSEKYNRLTKEYYIDETKNRKTRIFPMTEEIADLLKRVKQAETEMDCVGEYVFSTSAGRVHAPVISSCQKNKCRQLGIVEKGIHSYRRTINSKWRCAGVSSVVCSELLGNTKEVNENYYTFDVTSLEDKRNIVSGCNRRVC